MLYALLALLLVIASRVAYRAAFPFHAGVKDVNTHLLFVREIREHGYRIPRRIVRFLLDDNDYPQGFHWLMALSRIPLPLLERYGGHLSLAFDTAQLLIAAALIAMAGGHEYAWLLLFPLLRQFWFFEERAFLFGARAFGVLAGNVYLLGAFFAVQTGDWPWLILALAGFVGFATSSQFGWQAVTFFTLLLSALTLRWEYAAMFAACLAVATLITRGYAWTVMQGWLRHSWFYKTHMLKTNWGLPHYYRDWRDCFRRFRWSRFEHLLFQNPLAKWATNFPLSLPFFAVWASQGFALTPLAVYCLCGFILIPIIATEALKSLGEPDRYLDYATIPVLLYLSHASLGEYWPGFVAAVLVGLWAVWFQVRLKQREVAREGDRDEGQQALLAWAATLAPSTLLTIPLRTSFFLGYSLDQHRYVTFLANVGQGERYQALADLCPDYMGYPGRDLAGYVARYGVDVIIADRHYLHLLETKIGAPDYYDFSAFTPVYETPQVIAYAPTVPAP